MECFDSLIVDLDGVVWRDGAPIAGNVEALRSLAERGVPIVYLTNNSTRSRRVYSLLLTRILGYRVPADMVVNSGYSAAEWIRRRLGPTIVLPVGEEGLVEELALAGHTVATPGEWRLAKAVAVGLDRSLTYRKLAAAHKAIVYAGALFVATNRDRTYPVADGLEPGAGAVVAALEASVGRPPDFDAGKPGEWILGLAMERLQDSKNPLVVGDRVETDIEMARKAGIKSLLVLTGVTRKPPEGVVAARDLSSALREGIVAPC